MATNQRENLRKEKKQKKQHKITVAFWCVVLVVILAIIVMKVCEIDFSTIKDKISGNSNISSAVSDESKFPYSLDNSDNVVLLNLGNNIFAVSQTSIVSVNSSNGKKCFSDDHGYANPISKTRGSYALVFDQGSNKYRLDSGDGNIYTDTVQNSILTGDISGTGTVALATTSSDSLSQILVYSKSLNEKFNYSVSSGYVTAVAVDESARRVAFAVVNSKNAKLQTVVYTMNIGDSEPKAQFEYEGSSVINIRFLSSNLYVVGSDFISVITSMKNEVKVFEQGSVKINSYTYNSSENLVAAYTAYDGESGNTLALVSSSGKIKHTVATNVDVKDITASSSDVAVLTDSSVIVYNFSKGEIKTQYSVDDSYSSILQISSKIFAKHRSYIELLTE